MKVANSRGPETIEADVLAFGARAVTTAEAVEGVEVVILSIPLMRLPEVAPLIANLPAETVVMDTSNYYSPAWLKGRWRATMAHEGSHVILHRVLFAADRGPRHGEPSRRRGATTRSKSAVP